MYQVGLLYLWIRNKVMNNQYKQRCNLTIGSSFIFQGYYCIVKKMKFNVFWYFNQETNMMCYMTYEFYTTTNSFKGRKLY